MEKPGRVTERIEHIREALANIVSDIGNQKKPEFLEDGKTQRAVVESLIVIGEAAKSIMHLDPAIEQRYPLLWQHLRDAYDMRIILTHEYFRVDASIVWETIQSDLPKLAGLLDDPG